MAPWLGKRPTGLVHELLGYAAHVDTGTAQAPAGPLWGGLHKVAHSHLLTKPDNEKTKH